jgi:hypothetical protein
MRSGLTAEEYRWKTIRKVETKPLPIVGFGAACAAIFGYAMWHLAKG